MLLNWYGCYWWKSNPACREVGTWHQLRTSPSNQTVTAEKGTGFFFMRLGPFVGMRSSNFQSGLLGTSANLNLLVDYICVLLRVVVKLIFNMRMYEDICAAHVYIYIYIYICIMFSYSVPVWGRNHFSLVN